MDERLPIPNESSSQPADVVGATGLAGKVMRVWRRAAPEAAMEPCEQLELEAGAGVVGDHTFGRMRHVTIVFADDWAAATAELGRQVDPVARRANVLVSGGGGRHAVGRMLRIGPVLLEIVGIVAPCAVMERGAVGLRKALVPDGRSGVWGRVRVGGLLSPDDVVSDAGPVAGRDETD